MRTKREKNFLSTMVRAALLTAVLIAVGLAYYVINKNFSKLSGKDQYGQVTVYSSITNYNKTAKFNDAHKKELDKSFAGFWRYESDSSITGCKVRKIDNLEFRDNGIIWEVLQWIVKLPTGDSLYFAHVFTAFTAPFSRAPYDSTRIVSETRILRQAFVHGADTCYGESQFDSTQRGELWELGKAGGMLLLNHRPFKKYTGETSSFFPQGMVAIVDELQLTKCENLSLAEFAKEGLESELREHRDLFKNESIIKSYYEPMFVDELIRRFPDDVSAYPDSVAVAFSIDTGGKVTSPHLIHEIVKKRFEELLLKEMETWRMLPESKSGECTFYLRRR